MVRRSAKPAGLALVSDLSEASFAPFLRLLGKKRKGGVEGVAELTRQQYNNVCSALEQHVQTALANAFPVPEANMEEDQQAANDLEGIVLALHGAALLALDLLARSQQQPSEQLQNVAIMLHDNLLMGYIAPDLGSMQSDLEDAVARLCCVWWERRAPGCEMLVPRTIPYVLLRAIQNLDRSKTTLVHSCYVIREALDLLDFEDETIKDTKRLLLCAAMHPAFLRAPEGRRFIAGLFRLEPQMTRELGAIMRNQIQSGQRSALEAYGEILFRAWRDTVGPCAAEVESDLQGLMQRAILASTPALATTLRVVLDGLHSQKNLEKRLHPLLVRMYDPILPRAFAAANSEVRRNAVNLLVAAFPIVDPEEGAAENNLRMTQQLGFLMESLADACPGVREAAVEGCCRCLKLFWEIIPAATSAKMIGDITGKLAFDSSSRAVRIVVLRGLRSLLDSQHALPVLKKALPGLADLLYDTDSAVREALADLLVAISSCRGLPFWGVVAPEQLLETVAVDSDPAVARKIARILVPSYFPNAQEGSARLGALLRAKPEAGLAFCRHLVARFLPSDPRVGGASSGKPEFTASVPLEQILQLTGDLMAHLLATAPGLGEAAAGAQQQQPSKRAKAGAKNRGKNATGGQDAAVRKKRAKKKAAAACSEQEDGDGAEQQEADEAGADNGAPAASGAKPAGNGGAASDEDVLQDAITETQDGWLAILEGIVQVAEGLSAAVTNTEECGVADVESALGGEESLGQLLTAAEQKLRKPKAAKLVLKLIALLNFTPAARYARAMLFERLAQGALPGLGNGNEGDAMEVDGAGPSQKQDVGLLAEFLKALAAGSTGPKLAAMLGAALGAREPLPVRKPVTSKKAAKAGGRNGGRDALEQLLDGGNGALGLDGHGAGDGCDDDETICQGCKRPEPCDTMLLCDGCDAGCHIHCLRPALQEIPESDWFCWRCETQLQTVQLPAADAGRCLGLLLQLEEGRALLCEHPSFDGIIQAMHELAMTEADAIHGMAQAGAADEADSAPADDAAATPGDMGDSTLMLGDPWGALSRYCRAALHRAMWASMPHPQQPGQEAEEEPGAPPAQPTPRQTPASAGRGRKKKRTGTAATAVTPAPSQRRQSLGHQLQAEAEEDGANGMASLLGFYEFVPVVDYAMQTCARLADLVLEAPCLAAQLAALQYSQDLLRMLHFVQQTGLMNMGAQYVATVASLCNTQAALVHAAATALANQGGGSREQQACISSTLHVLLVLAQQLAEVVRTDSPDGVAAAGVGGGLYGNLGGGGVTPAAAIFGRRRRLTTDSEVGDEDLPSQQLEARMNAAAGSFAARGQGEDKPPGGDGQEAAEEEAPPPPCVSVEQLAVVLVALLCDAAVASMLKGTVRVAAADMVGELLSSAKQAPRGGWLDTLCSATGTAITLDPRVTTELEAILRSQGADGADAGAEGNADAADGGDGNGQGVEGGVVKGVQRDGRGGGKKAAAAGASASEKAQQATAAKLSELLQQESPAVGTMATVLVRVCAARKAHGRAMLLLAPLASVPLAAKAVDKAGAQEPQQQEDGGEGEDAAAAEAASALGAAVLLSLCRAAAPPVSMAQAVQQQPAVRRRGAGRCGMLAQEAAAQAERAEAEAAMQAFAVLRSAAEEGRALQPMRQQQQASGAGVEGGPRQVQCLARLLVQGLIGGAVAAVN